MQHFLYAIVLAAISHQAISLIYDPEQVGWNLNQNRTATNPLDYWGQWPNHSKLCNRRQFKKMGLTICSLQSIAIELAVSLLYPNAR